MKYYHTFKFCNTEDEAKKECSAINSCMTKYMRKNHPAHYTIWHSQTDTKWIVWYQYHV